MPVSYENKIFYSIEELSQIIRSTQEELMNFTREIDTKTTEIQGVIHINKLDVEKFFEDFFAYLGMSRGKHYNIPEYLKNCTSPWATTLVEMYENKLSFPASLSPEQGEFLRSLICNINPNNILEIGCFTGISTIWMASGLEQVGSSATIHSVDLFNEIMPFLPHRYAYLSNPLELAQNSVASAQLSDRVKFYKMNSVDMGKRYTELINEPIDFLFIDGDHSKEGCLADFMYFEPYVTIGGYIMLHDVYPEYCSYDGPRYVIDEYIKPNPNFELIEIKTSPLNYGMALIRKLSNKIDKKLGAARLQNKLKLWASTMMSRNR